MAGYPPLGGFWRHAARWGSGALLLLAACTPGPASSADALAEATRLAGQEQRATAAAAQETANAAQRQSQETQGALQATAMQATAGAMRATEISTRATSIAVEAAALERNAEASATAAVIAATIRALPTQAAATATRQAAVAQRADRVTDLGWLTLAWACLAAAVCTGLALIQRRAWAAVDAVRIARDMRRLLVTGPAYDASKQQPGGANGNGHNANDGSAPADGRAVPGVQPGHDDGAGKGGVRP